MSFGAKGKVTFVLGGQFGSEAKGAACAHIASKYTAFDVVTANNGCQSGHTSIHNGRKRILFHLPTYPVMMNDLHGHPPVCYLNAGAVIDPDVLRQELEDTKFPLGCFFIHPNAAVITPECREAEGRADSAQTKIASTRKGVGEALARKILRSGLVARDHDYLKQFVRRIDLNARMSAGAAVLAEVPQGFSLGIDQPFYPHTTSRNCTVMQAMSDAGIHPEFYGASMLVVRSYPIRVGHIEAAAALPDGSPDLHGHSGGAYPGQRELSWQELGQTPEITTVTKRVRRVFEFSPRQLLEAMEAARPTHVFLSFCDYLKHNGEQKYIKAIHQAAHAVRLQKVPEIVFAYGPSTDDVQTSPRARAVFNPDDCPF